MDSIRSSSVCRVLVISRAAYQSVERAFPVACRNVWSALQRVAEAALDEELQGHMRTRVGSTGKGRERIHQKVRVGHNILPIIFSYANV